MTNLARAARFFDGVNERVGRAVSWLAVLLVLNTFLVALLRYGFNVGWVWMQETYVWAHGAIIMLAVGYAFLHETHVRIDIFYRPASPKTKAWIDILGTLFFLLPTIVIIGWFTFPYVWLSWERLEVSREAGGMPGLFLWKTTMIGWVMLLVMQGCSLLFRSILTIRGEELSQPASDEQTPAHGG
jgi:TRAP-type mannitol/chloroaromatic compound transport system permease small subunit